MVQRGLGEGAEPAFPCNEVRGFMSSQYLLPCPCGQKLAVEPRQAGETIRCGCGESLDVPTMLEIKALEPLDPNRDTARSTSAAWSVRKSMALLGLVICVLAMVLAAGIFRTRPEPPPGPPEPAFIRTRAEALTPIDTLRVWQTLRVNGLDPRRPPEDTLHDEALFRYHVYMGVVGLLGVLGIVLCLTATLTGHRRR